MRLRLASAKSGSGGGRAGLTLIEVLVAVAILLLSFVAIHHLVQLSTSIGRKIALESQAMQLCQSKMAEFFAGVEQLNSTSETAFDEDPSWRWSANCNQETPSQGSVTNLWTVQIKVSTERDGDRFEAVLTQMMLDPSVRGTNLNFSASSTGSSGSSSSGTTTGGM